MRVVALVQGPDHVCARYRLAAFAPFLAGAGHQLEILTLAKGWYVSPPLLRSLRQADAVILQRRLLPWWQLRILRGLARHLIFDFDDAVFLRDSYAAKGLDSPRRLSGFRAMVQSADAVVAGNRFLADHAGHWTTPDRVRVIPTCVDLARYPQARHEGKKPARLVWIGSSSTLQGLERRAGLLDRLGNSAPELRLRIICDRPLELSSLAVEFRPWSSATEAEDLAESDLGISWLPEDDWSRGKCGLKVLQYMAAGLPVIANSVGVQTDLVRDGSTGFLAQTEDDWRDALLQLMDDPDLRRQMGQAGRRRVEKDFDVNRGAASWLNLLNDLSQPQRALTEPPAAESMKSSGRVASAGAS